MGNSERMFARSVPACRALATRAQFCTASVKATTNLVGLDVVPNAPEILADLYTKTLEEVQSIPKTSEYRVNVEKITNYRLKVVNDKGEIDAIESVLGLQVEEMINEAKDELNLIPKMLEWKPWEDTTPDVETKE